MDRTGVVMLLSGIVLCALGGYAIWAFLPEVIIVLKGLAGIAVVCGGLVLVLLGILIIKD